MKLLRLKLNDDFRSLQKGFEVYFLRDFDKAKIWDFMPYCLVGRNGHGKSNILEVLAAIFYHVECIYLYYKPDGFEGEGEFNNVPTDGFFAEQCRPDAFELEYLFPIPASLMNLTIAKLHNKTEKDYKAHILIEKKQNQSPKIKWLNRNEFADERESHEELNRVEVKYFLPDYVIGYASGENEILSLPFFKMRFIHYDEYRDFITKELPYHKPEGRLIFLDTQFSQAILLCNYIFQKPEILARFESEIGIEDVSEFRIIIKNDYMLNVHENVYQTLSEEKRKDEKETKVEITSKLKYSIELLKKCSTTYYNDPENHFLYLDYCVTPETKEAFRLNFDSALDLFQTFQILLTLNTYKLSDEIKNKIYRTKNLYINDDVTPEPFDEERIFRFKELRLKKEGVNDVIYTKSLSDGEHQLLHSIGICLLFKDKNALFLLDEPETHFNSDWKAKFISTLRDCLTVNNTENNVLRELLITSHSPFVVSDCKEENVLVFKKDDKTKEVTCNRPGFNTFGASVNLINIKVFGKTETIGSYANESLNKLYTRLKNGENKDELIEDAQKLLGDSVEKIIFINKVLESTNNS